MSGAGNRERHEAPFGSGPQYCFLRFAAAREAEERDRQKWIESVRLRLGIVTIGQWQQAEGLSAGEWEVISDHTLELPIGLPPECRCVIADGELVSLGGPCPVHSEPGWVSGQVKS